MGVVARRRKNWYGAWLVLPLRLEGRGGGDALGEGTSGTTAEYICRAGVEVPLRVANRQMSSDPPEMVNGSSGKHGCAYGNNGLLGRWWSDRKGVCISHRTDDATAGVRVSTRLPSELMLALLKIDDASDANLA
jgi:hypothetical protein